MNNLKINDEQSNNDVKSSSTSLNPFKISKKKLEALNNTTPDEIRITRHKVYKKETPIVEKKKVNPSSSSSTASSPSPRAKRESDNELEMMNNGLFKLNKQKRLKKSGSNESVVQVASSLAANKKETKGKKCNEKKNDDPIEKENISKLENERIESEEKLQKLYRYLENNKKQIETGKKRVESLKELESKLNNQHTDENDTSTNDELNLNLSSNSSTSSIENNDIIFVKSKSKEKKLFNYELIDEDQKMEKQISKLRFISLFYLKNLKKKFNF